MKERMAEYQQQTDDLNCMKFKDFKRDASDYGVIDRLIRDAEQKKGVISDEDLKDIIEDS